MTHFKEYCYYLKDDRWVDNNSLADTTIRSSSITETERQKDLREKTKHVTILDLEMWSEYKIKRLAEESKMD